MRGNCERRAKQFLLLRYAEIPAALAHENRWWAYACPRSAVVEMSLTATPFRRTFTWIWSNSRI